MKNPFRPGYGIDPPLLVGRDQILEDFSTALKEGPGSIGRSTLYTGARGTGKTVVLNAVENIAREQGWLVISETADKGIVQRLTESRLPKLLNHIDPNSIRKSMSSLTLPLGAGGVTLETIREYVVKSDLRDQITIITDILREWETGLLITLDEVHYDNIEELRQIAITLQHAFREDRNVAFAAAGLRSSVSDLLNDNVLTFLRRSERHEIGAVPQVEVSRALQEPILRQGGEVEDLALREMTESTQGYPFLIQLIGSHCWLEGQGNIQVDDARKGVSAAKRRLGSLIYEPALNKTSAIDRSFLLAMAQDDGSSKMSNIVKRLEVDKKHASVYRQRLLDADLIEAAGWGLVDFKLPYLRNYLREHATSLVIES